MKEYSTYPTRKILDALGCPDKKLKIIHIAGTNGKGSTAQFFTSVLVAAGKRTGTFVSPMVYSFYDQIMLDGKTVEATFFDECMLKAQAAADGASEFEILTAAAIYAFCKAGCEYAVIECGMGGLNDATNAVSNKQLAIITSISMEHTAFLGDTIERICAQKAGIIKDCPAVINAYQCEAAKRYFKSLNCTFADKLKDIGEGGFTYGGRRYEINASGCLQPYNAATVIEGATLLGLDGDAIYRGIASASISGRIEELTACGVKYILDGAHNPAAFVPLARYLGKGGKGRVIIFACLDDKDIEGNLAAIAGTAEKIIAVKSSSPRTRSAEDIAAACAKYFKNVGKAESVQQALEEADGTEVVVCGSFTTLKETKEWIEKRQ